MTVKVNYDPITTLVKGYYPDFISYNSIPIPYIEISLEDHKNILGKNMCVVDGVLQEYQPSSDEIQASLKNYLIKIRKSYLASTDWQASAFIKYGRPIDDGIKERCQQARDEIHQIEAATTLDDLNQFNF